MFEITTADKISYSLKPTKVQLQRFEVLEKKIKEKYKNSNFCYTNGSKMNYKLYDSKKEYKTFTFVKSELNKMKPELVKGVKERYKRCLQVENQITEKKEHTILPSSKSLTNTIYSISKEYSLITQKYKKLKKEDDEISLLSSIDSVKATHQSAKQGNYFDDFVNFCFYKKQFLDVADQQLVNSLKNKSKFTKDFLELDFNIFSDQDFKINQKELIEYKLLIDYLQKEFQFNCKQTIEEKMFCRMKSSFILFSVSFYKSRERALPTGVTSYYTNVKGNYTMFSKIVDNMLLFKRFFDMGNFNISIEEFLHNIKIFGCEIETVLNIYENFDDLLEITIKAQKYDDYRDYLIMRLNEMTESDRKVLDRKSLREHNYAVSLVVKKFLEDYTSI